MEKYPTNKYQEPSLDQQRDAVMSTLFQQATTSILPGFPPPQKAWQPSDRIPSLAELYDDPQQLKHRITAAQEVPDEIMVCLIGNEVTEAVLGNYTRELERTFPQTPQNINHPFHQFGRYWAAEEQRHGTILDRYLQFSKRINHTKVDETIHQLNQSGFDTRSGASLYQGIIYPRIQEHLTALAHINVGRQCQDPYLEEICKSVTADETRHKNAYNTLTNTLMSIDPEGTTIALGNLVRKGIIMPAVLMNPPDDPDLYGRFTIMAATQNVLGPTHMLSVHQGLLSSGKYGLGIQNHQYTGPYKDEAEQAREFILDTYVRILLRAADLFSNKTVKASDFSWMRT